MHPWDCIGLSKGVLGTCGFVPGAWYKPAGAQYYPGVPKTTLSEPLGLYWVIKGGIGHLRVCTGHPVQTRRCPIFLGVLQNNSECTLGIVLGYQRAYWAHFVPGAWYKPAGAQYSHGVPKNNSECTLETVLGYQRGVLSTCGGLYQQK